MTQKETTVHDGATSAIGTALQTDTFTNVTGNPEYDGMICKLCVTVQNAEHHILDAYWEIGGSIEAYIDELESKSVSAALKKISQHVREASNGRLSELGVDSLRKALKLRKSFTETQLELAKTGCVSLRNLLPMCNNDVTPTERDEILQDVTEGELSQKEIPSKVKELHPPEQKQEKRGGARKKAETPMEFMKRIQGDMDKLLTDMKESYRLHAATALGSEDQITKEEYTHYFEANAEQIEQLKKQWAANEKVTKVFLDD
jgi:hypothetical protein